MYVGVVGSATDIGVCADSIRNIRLRSGDSLVQPIRATKGYEARQAHFQRFLASHHGAILLLDSDMVFEPDTLERLRSHGLPFVSGYYMRRQFKPIAPVWFEDSNGGWPLSPWLKEPERGKLHKLGASGWGVMYMTREVPEAMMPLLKGEWLVAEDDMDIWPYDLDKVMSAIRTLKTKYGKDDSLAASLDCKSAVETLVQEIRPLRGQFDGDIIGSDLRFPFYAKAAGFQLWGDPDVRPGHILDYPLSPDDYSEHGGRQEAVLRDTRKWVSKGRAAHRKRLRELCT